LEVERVLYYGSETMNRLAVAVTLATAFGFLTLTGTGWAEEERIAVEDLPRAVLKAVKTRFPRAEIKAAVEVEEEEDDEEEDETRYEVSLEFKGHNYDVTLESDGKIVEIEKEISVDELPRAVKKALAARHPGVKIEKVEEVTRGNRPPYYEVIVKAEVAFTAKGRLIEADEEEERDEKPAARTRKPRKERDEDDDDDRDD
jgi:hypothetical protein